MACSKYLLWYFILIILTASVAARAEFIADGVLLTPLTKDGKSMAAAWAWHGNKIAFVRKVSNTQGELLIMNADGTGEEAVTPIGNPFFVEWSWAGDKLSYEFSNANEDQSQGGVFIYEIAAQKTTPVSAPTSRSSIDGDDGAFWSADDQYVVYKLKVGPSQTRQLWMVNVLSGKIQRLLPDRGQGKEQRWGPLIPPKLCLQIEASAERFDIAAVEPDGRNLVLLTNIGTQSINTDSPRWSPAGEWVAFTSDADMTQTERELERKDCWVGRPDGSQVRNLTKATSPSTELQLFLEDLFWSWDGRWIISDGDRFDKQGNAIPTYYIIDPIEGGYRPLMTSDPKEKGELDRFESAKWSYDSSKIAFLIHRSTVRNWGPEPQFENERWVLSLYDVRQKKVDDILIYNEQLDRKKLVGDSDRDDIADISWSPDGRSILLTIATIVSKEGDEGILQTDVYRLDLPSRFISESASQHIGPSMGRAAAAALQTETVAKNNVAPAAEPNKAAAAVEPNQSLPSAEQATPAQDKPGFVTKVVKPLHMPVEEAIASLSARYKEYFTANPSRNILLFKGPPEVLAALSNDLKLIDTSPPHILVDFLAVELSDEADRNLGLDWTYSEGGFALFQPGGNAIRDLAPDVRLGGLTTFPGDGQTFYQGVGRLPREFFVRLSALVKDGDATILANPRTVAMSGKESLIQIRRTLNFFFNEGFDTAGRPIVKKSDITADTIGRIIPTLLPDGRIYLVVDVSVGTFTFTQETLPEQTSRQSTTSVTVKEGETIVIGGLRQQEMKHTVTKVPILGDVPFIGVLFKKQESQITHSVLTIFITPQVLKADNPIPQWPEPNAVDYKIVPIFKDESCPTKK